MSERLSGELHLLLLSLSRRCSDEPAAGRPLWPSPSVGETHQRRPVAREPPRSPRRTPSCLLSFPFPSLLLLPGPCGRACAQARRAGAPNRPPASPHRSSSATRRDSFPLRVSVVFGAHALVVLQGLGLAWSGAGISPDLGFNPCP